MTTVRFRYDDTDYALEAIKYDHITACIERAGTFYELDLLEAIRAYERPGTYVDVGAHIGNHSVFFAGECSSQRVVSFEPNPIALHCLNANAARYPVEVVPRAIHDTWGWCRVIDPSHTRNHGMARIEQGDPIICIRCVRLDDCDLDEVAVIKIDVEGCELSVLRSATNILERDRPIISAEAQTPAATAAVDACLEPFGYRRKGVYGFTPTHIWTVE
jgi:FkbM family methyltransferase